MRRGLHALPLPALPVPVLTHGVAPNADGVDIDASQRVLVQNSEFTVSDDAICIKSGIDWFAVHLKVSSCRI